MAKVKKIEDTIPTTEVISPVVDLGILTKTHIGDKKIISQVELPNGFISVTDIERSTFMLSLAEYKGLR